jgi:hypothetical protein
MAVRDDFTAGEVLAAADLNDTFASKLDLAGGKIRRSFRLCERRTQQPAPQLAHHLLMPALASRLRRKKTTAQSYLSQLFKAASPVPPAAISRAITESQTIPTMLSAAAVMVASVMQITVFRVLQVIHQRSLLSVIQLRRQPRPRRTKCVLGVSFLRPQLL